MSDMTVGFSCRECGAEDNEAEVVIDSPSSPGSYSGLPEDCWPGEGCAWHAEAEVACHACGAVHDDAWMDANLDDEVQRREAERGDDDGY